MKILLIISVLIIWTKTLADQSPGPGPEYADVVFLVDSSDHLGTKSFPFVRTFINRMISSLPIEASKYRVALAQYSDLLHNEFQLNTFKSRNPMLNHLKKNFRFLGGSLRIGNALREAHRTYFSRPTIGRDKKQFPPVLVVLASAESEDDVEEAAKALREDGVRIVSVGMQRASEENLRAMATAQFHFSLRTVRDLSTFSQNMTQIIKEAAQYREGAAEADDVQAPIPVTCQKDSLADLVFLVDESVGNIHNLRDLQRFLKNITSSVDVKDNCVRLGLMRYGKTAETISFLNSSKTQSEFQQQIQKLTLRTGKSNAGAAIEKLRREGFSAASGSRRAQGVPQMAVLITNRASDDQVREAALSLRLEGTTVFTMSIQGANNTQLEEIASYPPEQTISKLKSYADLVVYSKKFLKKFQNEIWSQISTHAEQMELDKTGCVDTKEADIYFLIDGSTSIQRRNFKQIKDFMSAVIEMFYIGPDKVQVGVVQYSNRVELEFSSNVYSNAVDLKKAVFNIKQLQGETLTGAALRFMLSEVQEGRKQRASPVPSYLIVLTDGKSMDRVLEPAERLRAEHITIYAIGIGEANKTQLKQIAGKEENVYFGNNFDALKSIKRDVIHGICTEKGCEDMKTDIMFLVDSSGSIGHENFEKMKNFMKNLSAKLQIGADKIQIGVVQFSSDTKEEFQLDKYFTQKEILDAIDRMYYIGHDTFTGKALNFVPQYFFSPSKGARSDVKKFLILITDGEAHDDVRDPAKALRDKGVTIFSVGVYGANRSQLEEISGDSSQVFQVENFDHLKAIEHKLIFHMCAVHDCKRIELLDVVFVLDHSGSIQQQQQESMIDLAIRLVNKTHVGSDQVQFGALKYSEKPDVLFYLNTYSTKQAIRENLRTHRSTGGPTYTARALEFSNNLFTEERGSRIKKNVKQMLIVITDGESHDREMLNEAASKLRDKGIIIYAVGVGKANQNELEIIAGNKNYTIHVDDFDKLKDVYHLLQESMCNNAQEVCNIPEADVIFLCDSSSRVSESEFVTMTTFLSDLGDNFDIQSQKIKLGVAQFGSTYKEVVGLNDSLTKSQWKNLIQTIKKTNEPPQVDFALRKVKLMFNHLIGRRVGVPQTLVVILSGPPQGNVTEAVKDLKDLGICILAWGLGDVQKQQLLPITDNPGKIVTFQDFNKLKDMDVRKRMVREVCQSCWKTNCFVDIVVGFDISTHLPGQRLFHGHSPLESSLPGILEDITSIRGVSCGAGAETQVSVAFKVNSEENFPAKFQIYQKAMFGHLLQPLTVNGPTQLNAQFLQSLWDTFESRDTAQGQVLLIFSDGIGGESITLLEDTSDRLREAGLDALLVVSLDPAAHDQFSSFEFGKGFDYRTHLTIGMRELGGLLSQYLGNIAERTCCCTVCKCAGPPGPPGAPGVANMKGSPGLKGSRGHRGEDGDPGTRGEKGLPGEKGTAGCPGERGQKGAQGLCGHEGERGEDGIDGLSGEEGVRGFPGEKGEKGDPGSQGSPGIRGSPGEYGKKGFSGDPGIPGINSNIKGQKGFKGGQGRQGRTGQKGMKGSPSPKGSRGREGQRGVRGLPGEPGTPGPKGELGPEGLQGPQGRMGLSGRKGEKGSHGPEGPQGSPGPMGAKGNHGRPGPLGRKGEPGFSGDRGLVGQAGQRGKQGDNGIPGYGQMGRKGIKGPRGFLGDMGQKGNVGDPGIPGSPGPKGFKGLSGSIGLKGEAGSRGPPGPPGRRGAKGMAGLPIYSQCHLIQFMRHHSPCWKEKCPVYPTELVFALDQSYDITVQRFHRMLNITSLIINDLHIMENNCPVGARVAVTAYDSHAWYLIRWFDYHNKKQLLQLLSQINYQPPTAPQDIGNAMRFVTRNVFKRTYAGPNVRRVAVFFSNRQAASLSSIVTATMEFSAWDISPAVIAFNEKVFLDEAFEFDNTGTFQVIPIPPNGVSESEQMERLWRCTLCYDKCFPKNCTKKIILPEDSYMDVALLLENSQYIVNDEFKALKNLVSSMLDNFDIASAPLSSHGDRIALLSYSPWDSYVRRGAVKTEFDFTAYSNKFLMKNYIQTHLQQLSGEATIGHSLIWTIENLFPRTPNLRRHKVIFVVSTGENYEKRDYLANIALKAKCQGFVIVVISLGSTRKDHLEELASDPHDHHLIRLGRIHKPDLDYIVKSLKPIVYSIRRGLNQYPSQMLENICRHMRTEGEDYLPYTPEPHEIALGENRFTGQEFSARRDSPLVLEDNGSDHLVYIPNHMVMPQELMINYEKVQDSEEVASLTSGDENHGRKEELGLNYQPGDASLQEYYMDVAFLIDASHRVGNDDFKEVKAFIISVLDYFHIAPDPVISTLGDRVAVLSYSPPGHMPNTEECPVYLEFDLVTYNSVYQMKHHLQNSLLKLNGDVFIGHALQWTIDNVFARTPNLRKNKVIFVISAGETNPLDKEVLRNVSLRAKCEGYSIFVFSFGPTYNEKELEELASHPLDHHLVQLGRTHKPDLNYIIKFIKPFVHLIRRAINKYPPADLRPKCVNITSPTPENVGTENTVFLIPGVYEIQTENSELSDEFGSQEQHFFALGNNLSNGSGTTADLIQKLYLLFSTGELRTKDKEEAHSEEITALANDKQRDEKDGETHAPVISSGRTLVLHPALSTHLIVLVTIILLFTRTFTKEWNW